MPTKTFILSDETVNEYGFWLVTAGGDLSQFDKNPLMLYMHKRAFYPTKDDILPPGKWVNTRTDGDKILAEPDFDQNDDFALQLESKVEGGYLRMASVGIRVIETSTDPKLLKVGQTRETVTKWQLIEASIVDIGANNNAIAFYDNEGNILQLTAENAEKCPVKLISNNENNQQTETMTEMKKTAGLLKLADKATDEELAAEVQKIQTSETTLKSENDTLKLRVKELEDKEKNGNKAEAVALVDAAVKDGRIDAAGKDSFLKLFESDHASAKVTLASIPQRKPVREQLKDGEGKNKTELEKLEKLSWDELDKSGKLETLKSLDIDVFKEKFKERYGKEYKG